MKILLLTTYYAPHWTGLTQYAKRLAEGFASREHSVLVLTSQHQKDLPSMEKINRVTIFRSKVLFQLSRTLISFELFLHMVQEIPKSDCVVIYLPYAEVLFAVLYAKLFHKRVILVHNGDLHLPLGMFSRFVEFLYTGMTFISCLLSDSIVVQTIDYAQSSPLLSRFISKCFVIFPLYPKQKIATSVTLKNVPKDKPCIGFAGRFVEEKGFDFLYKAIPYIMHEYPSAVCVYAGQSAMSYEHFFEKNRELIDTYASKVTQLGVLNDVEMQSFYRSIDVLVVPSRSDCFPSVVVEAQIASIPVVVSDIPGARYTVKKTGMGIVVDAHNPKHLAEAIIEVIRHKDRYCNQNKKRNVQVLFDYNKTLLQYESLCFA
jgi:glycosyltransferase involved in cell wall biosynthesis